MSGIEIAGLVLGSFPILLNCLDYYREGFEPLEQWWQFRTSFLAFTDDIRHQMMRYNENMVRLLDPIISDNESLKTLVQNVADPRWQDGSLDGSLRERLAGEHDRFLRIMDRMSDITKDLKRLLKVESGTAPWLLEDQRSLGWHFMRLRISFSKGKSKKVKRLAEHNQELEEILGYSERIIPTAESRKSSNPVAIFEKLRQLACGVHSTLKTWECSAANCHSHLAHLRLQADKTSVSLDVLFTLDNVQGPSFKPKRHEVIFQPATSTNVAHPADRGDIRNVEQATTFMQLQDRFEEVENMVPVSRGTSWFTNTKKAAAQRKNLPLQFQKKVARFAATTPVATPPPSTPVPTITSILDSGNLCSSLRAAQNHKIGFLADNYGRKYQLSRPSQADNVLTTARLINLSELLDACHKASIDVSRQRRFSIAAHITSALLQLQMSPWLAARWSKCDLYFFVDSQSVYNDRPYISQTFALKKHAQQAGTSTHGPTSSTQSDEDEARDCLFSVGIMIVELIFGYNIESCNFHHEFYGPNNQPNDLTDVATARKLAKKVLGDSGAEISDVVMRCLYCNFGLKPNFQDKRFKEAIYEGVIRPLTDYMKVWQPVMP